MSTVSIPSNPAGVTQEQARTNLTVATAVIAIPGILFILAVLMALLVTVYSVYRKRKPSRTGIGDPEYGLVENRKDDRYSLRIDKHHEGNKQSDEKKQLLVQENQIKSSVSCPEPPFIDPLPPNLQIEQTEFPQMNSSPGGLGTARGVMELADAEEATSETLTPIQRQVATIGPVHIKHNVKFELRFKKNGKPILYKRSARMTPFEVEMIDGVPYTRHGGRIFSSRQYYRKVKDLRGTYLHPIPIPVTHELWSKDSFLAKIPLWYEKSKYGYASPKFSGFKYRCGPPKNAKKLRIVESHFKEAELENIPPQDSQFGMLALGSRFLRKSSSMVTHAPSFQLYSEESARLMEQFGKSFSSTASIDAAHGMRKPHFPDIGAYQGALSQPPVFGEDSKMDAVVEKEKRTTYFSGASMSEDDEEEIYKLQLSDTSSRDVKEGSSEVKQKNWMEETYKLQLSDTSSRDIKEGSSEGKQKNWMEDSAKEQPGHIKFSTSHRKIEETSFIAPQESKSGNQIADRAFLATVPPQYPMTSKAQPLEATVDGPSIEPLNITRISSLVKQLISSTESESEKETEMKKWRTEKRPDQTDYDKVSEDNSLEEMRRTAKVRPLNLFSKHDSEKGSSPSLGMSSSRYKTLHEKPSVEDATNRLADDKRHAGIHSKSSDLIDIQSLDSLVGDKGRPLNRTSTDIDTVSTVGVHPSRRINLSEGSDAAIPSVSTYLINKGTSDSQKRYPHANADGRTVNIPSLGSHYREQKIFPDDDFSRNNEKKASIAQVKSKGLLYGISTTTFRDHVLSPDTGGTVRTKSFIKSTKLRTLDSGTDIGYEGDGYDTARKLMQREISEVPTEDVKGSAFRAHSASKRARLSMEGPPEEGELEDSEWKGSSRGGYDSYSGVLMKKLSGTPLMVIEDALNDELYKRDSELLKNESKNL